MADAFKLGDLVQVKSGGPPMTIDGLPSQTKSMSQSPGEYWCIWFKGATRDQGSFGEHLLQRYEPPKT